MKKLVKGSKAAKDFMAKIRAKRKSKTAPKKAAPKKAAPKKAAAKKAAPKKAAAKNYKLGSVNKFVYSSGKAIDEIKYRLDRINKMQNDIEFLNDLLKKANPIGKRAIRADITFLKKMIKDFKLQNNKLKKLIK
jgi:hypothetical protein